MTLAVAPLEGDIESAYNLLEDARDALERGMIPYAQNTVREAIGLLRTDESRFIAENSDALDDAIRVLSHINWS